MPGQPDNFNLAEYCLRSNVARRPDSPALIFHRPPGTEPRREVHSFQQFEDAVLRAAGVLRKIVPGRGERIFIRLESDPRFAILFFAAAAAGHIPVPSSPELTASEAKFLIQDAEPALTVYSPSLGESPRAGMPWDDFQARLDAEQPAEYANTRRDDPAFLVYTSGTSGKPRGVLHAHRSILGRIPMREGWTDLREGDRLLHAGRLNWTYTLGVGLMDPWAQGATGILYGGPSEPSIWPRLMREEKATIFAAVPGVYRRMLKYANLREFDLSNLRHGLTAGEKLLPELRESWREATNTELHEALGMSEISTYISTGPGIAVRDDSPGKAQPGRRIAVLARDDVAGEPPRILPAGESGLLAVHGDDPGLMLGYWKRPEEDRSVRRGEWFVGGDVAGMDQDGYVYYHGRNDEIMNASGYRVSPLEVDQVLQQHPAVLEAAALEWNVEKGLNIIVAFVVLREAPRENTGREILEFAAERLARYKVPREIFFTDALPRNANGKLQRKKLREWKTD